MPILTLFRGTKRLAWVDLHAAPNCLPTVLVDEDAIYSLAVESREPETMYAAWNGDQPLDTDGHGSGDPRLVSVGQGWGPNYCWPEGRYFANTRGRVLLALSSRPSEREDAKWTKRLEWPVYVRTTKITERAYESMCLELRALAAGILFDLVSKSTQSVGMRLGTQRTACYASSQIELSHLLSLWSRLTTPLAEIIRDPWKRLLPSTQQRRVVGSERLPQRSLLRMAEQGINPRFSTLPQTPLVECTVMRESVETLEHGVISGFLRFLDERVASCEVDIGAHIQTLEEDRPFRESRSDAGTSLYETEDAPRMARLRRDLSKARTMRGSIQACVGSRCLRSSRPQFPFVDSPVFRNVQRYREVRQLIDQYMSSSTLVLGEGAEQRVKSTSRLYEQWVFLQIASALRYAGLRCVAQNGVVQGVRRYRYTLDLARGASFAFEGCAGRLVVVRYEPWIHPRLLARRNRASLCRDTGGTASWSPDVLLEFLSVDSDQTVDYAVVVDAKYTTRVRDEQVLAVGKYQDIRDTETLKQVVRQVWIAAPVTSAQAPIQPRDRAVNWTHAGPDRGREEVVEGTLQMIPRDDAVEESAAEGLLAEPLETALDFVAGLLRYVDFV